MEASVLRFFERYQECFRKGLEGKLNMDEVAALYASDFIAASPGGVVAAKNDEDLKRFMAQGYERYRAMGTKEMSIRDVEVLPIDQYHCMAEVAWTAIYSRDGESDLSIDFDIRYFVQRLDEEPKVFGWVSGDEQALLREHGII